MTFLPGAKNSTWTGRRSTICSSGSSLFILFLSFLFYFYFTAK